MLDGRTIAIPDRPGHRRADGFLNVLGNPHAGLIFLLPGRDQTLRINGRAARVREAPFVDAMSVNGHRPTLALVVAVEEAFIHCPKAFIRSGLWHPGTSLPAEMPSMAEWTKAVQQTDESLDELRDYYGPSYAERLYRG